MGEEHVLIRQVFEAKEDTNAADKLIVSYIPFIKSETAKFLKRPVIEEQDDEYSIAMLAFYEAIGSYKHGKGAFLKYAALIIRSRLIDYYRSERKHKMSAELEETIPEERNKQEEYVIREATRAEIEELQEQMEKFGVTLSDVADHCPKQERTLNICRNAIIYGKEHPEILEELLTTKRLPIAKLCSSSTERKTLERHRKYLVAMLLVYTNGFEIIRGHLHQVMKRGNK